MGISEFGTLQQTHAAVSWCVLLIWFDSLFEHCISWNCTYLDTFLLLSVSGII